jgi:hypothetical protein
LIEREIGLQVKSQLIESFLAYQCVRALGVPNRFPLPAVIDRG